MNDLMSEQELQKVTGYKAQSKQCEVLTEHGIFFVKDANGIVLTTQLICGLTKP